MEAIAIRLDAIPTRLEIATRLEAIAIRLEAVAIRWEAIAKESRSAMGLYLKKMMRESEGGRKTRYSALQKGNNIC